MVIPVALSVCLSVADLQIFCQSLNYILPFGLQEAISTWLSPPCLYFSGSWGT